MINIKYSDEDILGNKGNFEIKQYFGNDALDCTDREDVNKDIRSVLFKEVIVKEGNGIVIGFEDNDAFFDYYYIVYLPIEHKIVYVLYNDLYFYKNNNIVNEP